MIATTTNALAAWDITSYRDAYSYFLSVTLYFGFVFAFWKVNTLLIAPFIHYILRMGFKKQSHTIPLWNEKKNLWNS
jgi:hypothetical protein